MIFDYHLTLKLPISDLFRDFYTGVSDKTIINPELLEISIDYSPLLLRVPKDIPSFSLCVPLRYVHTWFQNSTDAIQSEIGRISGYFQAIELLIDTFKHRIRNEWYPEPGRIGRKPRFTEEQIWNILKITNDIRNTSIV